MMLQDLILTPDQIVPGDHIVVESRWWKVVKIEKMDPMDEPYYSIRTVSENEGERGMTVMSPTMKVRTRPCGSSSKLEERNRLRE